MISLKNVLAIETTFFLLITVNGTEIRAFQFCNILDEWEDKSDFSELFFFFVLFLFLKRRQPAYH